MNILCIHPKLNPSAAGKISADPSGAGYYNVFAPKAVLVDGFHPATIPLGFRLTFPLGTVGAFAPTGNLEKAGIQVSGYAHSSDEEVSLQIWGGTSSVRVPMTEPLARMYVWRVTQPKVVVMDKDKPKEHPDLLLSSMMMPRKPMSIMKMPMEPINKIRPDV